MSNSARYGSYTHTSSGTDQNRDYGSGAANQHSTHTSYSHGGYSYSNPDGSCYQKGADGTSVYVNPSGQSYVKHDGGVQSSRGK